MPATTAARYTLNYWKAGEMSVYNKPIDDSTPLLRACRYAMDYASAGWGVELWLKHEGGKSERLYQFDPQTR